MTTEEAIAALDAIDASDPESAHVEADKILLATVPFPVRQAFERVEGRAAWWAFA